MSVFSIDELIADWENRFLGPAEPPDHFFFLAQEVTQRAQLHYPDIPLFAALRKALLDLKKDPDKLLLDPEFLKYLDCLDELNDSA